MIWPIRWTVYLSFIAQIVFIILKLSGVIQWHWLLVLMPAFLLIVLLSFLAWIVYQLS